MNNNFSYKLDDKVVGAMLIVAALFLGIMAFKYKTKTPCSVVNFSFRTANKENVVYTMEQVYFSSEVKYNADSWEWDFGDKTKPDSKSGPYVTHDYKNPGLYTVRLLINNKCDFARTIAVNRREDKGKKLYLQPLWPAEPLTAGREYNFGDNTSGAVTWSWYFDSEPKRLQQGVTYLFTEPGQHKVILVINDDLGNNKIEKIFDVKPAPVTNSVPIAINPPPNAGRPSGGGGGLNTEKVINDKLPGKSMEEIAAEAKKIPTVSDQVLKGYLISINGSGYGDLKKYFKNNSYNNCIFLFNDKNITVDQLKENIIKHNEYGQSFDVKQSINTDNNIIQIAITAVLKPKSRLIGKDKKREYPH